MPFFHLFLALVVAVVWGINFLFLKIGLETFPPLLLCGLRFILASIPAVFFMRPPKGKLKLITIYGLFMFALQFSLLFMGMYSGMTAGMASLIAQTQVFFSLFFAAMFLNERISFFQILGAVISFSGICLAAFYANKDLNLVSILFILAASATWGFGNLLTKKLQEVNALCLIVWGSFMASFPMLLLSWIIEGPERIQASYQALHWPALLALGYIVYLSTWVGYGLWGWLLKKYSVSRIAPFALLVPVVGMISSVLIFNEPMQYWKWLVFALVLTGLMINLLGQRLFTSRTFFLNKILSQSEAASG